MRCAKCNGQLSPVRVESIEVERCERCGGSWFDRGELNRLLREPAVALPEATSLRRSQLADAQAGTCPHCDVPLERCESLIVDGMGYDECPRCEGIWLDRGELVALADAPTAGVILDFFTRLSG